MRLTDLDVISICAALYDRPDDKSFWDVIWPTDGAYAAMRRQQNIDVVVWRGSVTALDWFQDLGSELPLWDKELGHCAAGFLAGMRANQRHIDGAIGNDVIVTGHSLGAAHAALYAAHLCAIGRPPLALIDFGEPRPGFERVRDLLKDVPVRSYRNLTDPVTEVPTIGIPGTAIDLYCHARELIALSIPAAPNDAWGPLRHHHISLYIEGVKGLGHGGHS